jgi:hypothetical protein
VSNHESNHEQCDCTFTPVQAVSQISGPDWFAVIYEGEDGDYGIEVVVRGDSQRYWAFDSIEHATEAARQVVLEDIEG